MFTQEHFDKFLQGCLNLGILNSALKAHDTVAQAGASAEAWVGSTDDTQALKGRDYSWPLSLAGTGSNYKYTAHINKPLATVAGPQSDVSD